jgi:arylsulfatase A-like enzyme
MLSALDDAVGTIQQKLESSGLDKQTLVFYLSDNGGHTPSNSKANGNLRGGKSTVYEGGVRVPFFVKWTGKLPAGMEYAQPVISLDILPTALAAAGAAVPSDLKLDGVNLLPYLSGERADPPHQSLYWRYGDKRAIRSGEWKLVLDDQTPHQLFDLVKDRAEAMDRSKDHPEIAGDLLSRYESWSRELEAPRWQSILGKGKGEADKVKAKAVP